jgi:hypothetical protein
VNGIGTRKHNDFAGQWLACMFPYRRLADVLADACARLRARYSSIVVDFHVLLLSDLPAYSLALRPAHSHGHRMS